MKREYRLEYTTEVWVDAPVQTRVFTEVSDAIAFIEKYKKTKNGAMKTYKIVEIQEKVIAYKHRVGMLSNVNLVPASGY